MKTHRHVSGRVVLALGLGLMVIGLAALSACIPPTPEQSALAGTWVFLTSALDTELTQLSVVVDETGNPTTVTYALGTAAPTTIATQGTAGLDGALATVNLTFGRNTLSMSGTLDGSATSIAGFVSLRLEVAPVTLTLTRTLGTLTRPSTPQTGQAAMTGTWTLSVPSTRLFPTLVAFSTSGTPTLVQTKIGGNVTRTDIAPSGSATATTDAVTFDVYSEGAVSAQDDFHFAGQFGETMGILEGTASLRVSAAETTIVIQDAAATLVKSNVPASGSLSISGNWDYQISTDASATSPVLTSLRLQFDANNLLSSLTYTVDNDMPVTLSGGSAQTLTDGALVSIKGAFVNEYFVLSGAVDTDQTALLGYVTLQLGGATATQQPAVFLRQ